MPLKRAGISGTKNGVSLFGEGPAGNMFHVAFPVLRDDTF